MLFAPIQSRLAKLRESLAKESFDGIFVADTSNVTYMSGYTNHESFLFITGKDQGSANIFITDFRYIEQAQMECPDYEIIKYRNGLPDLPERLAQLCEKYSVKRLAFERRYTPYSRYQDVTSKLPAQTEFVPSEGTVERLRYVKDETERDYLKAAAVATDRVFEAVCGFIRPGVTEKDVEWELIRNIHDQGCDLTAPCIVVSGVRGSLPHGVAGDKLLADREFITMDFGCMCRGYHMDMTRTVFVGRPDEEQKRLYDIVLQANLGAEALIKNGVAAKAVDAAARDYISAQGYAQQFGHGLGHGVGLDIHEPPFMSPTAEETLQTGCFITVEPGVYLPGWGGIRIEDTVMVTDTGCEAMFKASKELICL